MKSLRPLSSLLQNVGSRVSASSCPVHTSLNSPLFASAPQPLRQQRRAFLPSPFSASSSFTPNQTLTASRILPYPNALIYEIISDVASYSQFLPYCQKSVVTKTSAPSAVDGKQYPEEATLTIGFNDSISEAFTSRVYCVPHRIVEAVSGTASTSLSGDEISHHSPRPTDAERDASRKDTMMASLLTRWTLRPYHYKPPPSAAVHPQGVHKNHEETSSLPGQERTEVSLAVEFQFSNPLYAAVSAAAAPKVAEKMIEAFEKRVQAVLHGPGSVTGVKPKTPYNDNSERNI